MADFDLIVKFVILGAGCFAMGIIIGFYISEKIYIRLSRNRLAGKQTRKGERT